MSVMEILTLLLVIFAVLSYIDNHKKKKHPSQPKVEDAYSIALSLRAIGNSILITFLSRLYTRPLEKSSGLFILSQYYRGPMLY